MLYIGIYWLWDVILIILIILAFIMGFFMGLLTTFYFIIGTCFFMALMVALQPILVYGWTKIFKWLLGKIVNPNEGSSIFLLQSNIYFYSYYLTWIAVTFVILLICYFLLFRYQFKKVVFKSHYQRYLSSFIFGTLTFFVLMIVNSFLATNLFYTTKTIQGLKINELVTKSIFYSVSNYIIGRIPSKFNLGDLFLININFNKQF